MPDIYEVKAPDGSMLEVQSDGPPTAESAMRAIRAYGDQQAAAAQSKAEAASEYGAVLRPLARGALQTLPAVGAVVGGALSAPTGGVGTVPAIALGAGAGRGLQDLISHATGLDAPSTPWQKMKTIAGETAATGATAAILPGLVKGALSPIQTLGEAADQFSSALPPGIRRLGRLLPSFPSGGSGPMVDRPAWQTWPETLPTPPGVPPMSDAAYEAATGHPRGVFPIKPLPVASAAESPAPASPMLAQRNVALKNALGPSDLRMAELQQKFGGTQAQPAVQPIPNETAVPIPHPLTEPRLEVGADRVGRQQGMTGQQVREATGSVRGEPAGSPKGMPSKPMNTIVDKLIQMGPKGSGGPESARDVYAAAANSDKARLQVQAYLDALRKVGFAAPLAMAPAVMHRQMMLDQLKD